MTLLATGRLRTSLESLEKIARIKAMEKFISLHWGQPEFDDPARREEMIGIYQNEEHADLLTRAIAAQPELLVGFQEPPGTN